MCWEVGMQIKKLSVYAGTAIACAVFFVLLWLYLFSVGTLTDSESDSLTSEIDLNLLSFSDEWVYADSGLAVKNVSGKGAHMALRFSDASVQITRAVGQDIGLGQFLCFRADVTAFSVFCNDTLLYAYTNPADNIDPQSPHGLRFFTVALPQLSAEDRITLRMETKHDGLYPIQYMSLGRIDEIYMYILLQQLDTAIVCCTLVIFAIFQIGLSAIHLLMRIRPVRHVYIWLSFVILLATTWIGLDSGFFILFIQSYPLYYTLWCLSFMLLPGAAVMFLNYCGTRTSRFALIFCGADAAFTVLSYLLYYWGIIELGSVIPFFCLLAVAVLGYMLVKLVRMDVERNLFYFSGMLILFVISAISLVAYGVHALFFASYLFKYGMLSFVICMVLYIMMDIGRLLALEKRAAVVESQKSLLENELFLTQIGSHFFYNTMNMIRGLIKMDSDAAYHLTDDFVKYIRSHVEAVNAKDGMIPFSRELESVAAYARISSVRMNNALHIEYDIETVDFEVPALTLEPLVENAIRHGVFPKGEGNIQISVRDIGDGFSVTVTDDGVGFQDLHEGVGISNIRHRLSRYAGCHLTFESVPNVGTTAEIVYSKNIQEGIKNENDVGGRQSD